MNFDLPLWVWLIFGGLGIIDIAFSVYVWLVMKDMSKYAAIALICLIWLISLQLFAAVIME